MAIGLSGEVPLTKFFPRMYDSKHPGVHSAKGPDGSQGERPPKRGRWTHASQDNSVSNESTPSASLREAMCSERKARRQPSKPLHAITPNTSRSVTGEIIDLTEDSPNDSPLNHPTPSTTDLTIPATPISFRRRQSVATKSAPLIPSLPKLNLPPRVNTTASSCKILHRRNAADHDSTESAGNRTRNDGRHHPVSPQQCLPTPRSSIKRGVPNRRQRSPSLRHASNPRELPGIQSTDVLQNLIGQPELSPPTRENSSSDDIAQTSQSQIEKELSFSMDASELIGYAYRTSLPTPRLSVGPNDRQELHSLRDNSNVRGPIVPLTRGRSTDALQRQPVVSSPTSPNREDFTLCDIVQTSQSQLERELSLHMDFPDMVDGSVTLSPLGLLDSHGISRTPS
jgi:hypothetical protein